MKPVDVVLAGLNTILPLMTAETLKVSHPPHLFHTFFLTHPSPPFPLTLEIYTLPLEYLTYIHLAIAFCLSSLFPTFPLGAVFL